MSGVDFLDSNILVYLFDPRDPRRKAIAQNLFEGAQFERNAIISFQVVEETLSVATRKLQPPMSPVDAGRAMNDVLLPLCTIHPTPALYQRALDVQGRTASPSTTA